MLRHVHLRPKLAVFTAVIALGAFASLPAFAPAQDRDPTCVQYESTGTQITGDAPDGDGVSQACADPDGGGGPATAGGGGSGLSGNVGPLPFTGFDVVAMAAVGLAVSGLGLLLQRAVSRDPSSGAT